MSGRGADLDSIVRSRLIGPDEPAGRSDWPAVVARSRRLRAATYRPVAVAAALLAAACAVSLAVVLPGNGHPRAAAALRLSLQGEGRGVVLYSGASRARVVESSAGRVTAQPAALVRSLSGGPFHVDAALVRTATGTRHAATGPLPGDQALYSLRLFTTAGLGTTAGSAVLTCRYGLDRSAYCDGIVDLDDGMRLTTSGTLNASAGRVALVVSGGYCRSAVRCARLASPIKISGLSSNSRM
jgi:hypothetical protein